MKSKFSVEFDIYVPLVLENNAQLPQEELREIRDGLIEYFGGLTDMRQRNEGVWKFGGQTYHDDLVVWKVLGKGYQEEIKFLKETQIKLCHLLQQKQILVIRREIQILDS